MIIKKEWQDSYSFQYYPVPVDMKQIHGEGIQVLDYEKTQEYKFHHDVADEKSRQNSQNNINIIFTNDFEGGRTLFNHDAFKPKVGSFDISIKLVLSSCRRTCYIW